MLVVVKQLRWIRSVKYTEYKQLRGIYLDLFCGEGSFSQCIQHFESIAVINVWDDEEKLKWLHVQLHGKAQATCE